MIDWSTLGVTDLLAAHCAILDELRTRNILRSKNNPTGDYAEWLVPTKLGLRLENNSAKGWDATDAAGVRSKSKGRRVTPDNPSTQPSVIRNLDGNDFDVLIAVVFDEARRVRSAAKVPHDVVGKLATFRSHERQLRIELRGNLAAMLTAAQQTKRSPETGDLSLQFGGCGGSQQIVPAALLGGSVNVNTLEFLTEVPGARRLSLG